jgi:spore maturation protein CgeB
MRIFVFGSSLTSCYWNGAATYYRGIYKNLARLGHEITFAEPDIYDRQRNRDAIEIDYARVRVYRSPEELDTVLKEAASRELIIKHSGVGAHDEYLEAEVLKLGSRAQVAFWDVDAPATLARTEANPVDPFHRLIPKYDLIFTYGGGRPVIERYRRLGARNCYPIYNALDPDTHYPVEAEGDYRSDLAFVGHRLPDREQRVEEFFFRAAELLPEYRFLLGGEGWGTRRLPGNVRWIGHVGSLDHNRINCSARLVLNVNRESMAAVGFSPPTRVFEAAGAGACLITDRWLGIEGFFEPGREILVAASGEDVARYVSEIAPARARSMGSAMRRRALSEHTYELRAREVDRLLGERARAIAEEGEPLAQSAL